MRTQIPGSRYGNTVARLVFSLLGTGLVLFPILPSNLTLPSRDSGVFLYMAWRILSGDVPYRDVWDHKPPLIYAVDALGLLLTPDSLWGIWLLQFLFIFVTLYLIYDVLDREFGVYAAIAGTVILISGLLTILDRGNVTEEYALVFQAFCFWMFVRGWRRDLPPRHSFWIGVAGGLAFHFKQTTVGVLVAYGLVLLALRLWQRRSALMDMLSLFAGWLVPLIMILLYLAARDALMPYWEQAFLYNFVYIRKHEGVRRLIPVFIKGFAYLRNGWVLYAAGLGWLSGAAYLFYRRKEILSQVHPLLLIALVNLPVEIFFLTISGRSILHYYLTPLPVMAILAGTLVYTLPSLIERGFAVLHPNIRQALTVLVLGIILLGQVGQVRSYPEYIRAASKNGRAPVIDYIVQNTTADDQVLLIGAESVVNFLARREAPTRYVYQYPLALLGRRPMFEEYFHQILENKPALIIDTRGHSQLVDKLYTPLQKRSEVVREGVKYLGENYQQVAQFGDWFVYRFVGSR